MASVNVSNFSQLKAAIEDASSTEIIVNGDIIFESGAKVNFDKSNLIIDFLGHSVTDSSSLSISSTIYVAATTKTVEVTIKNAVWNGKTYYGVVGVQDGNTNTTINLENINYTGPQFVYNKNGTTNVSNCTINVDKNNSSARAQEFCEANRLNILGNVKVISNSTSDAVVWFSGENAALVVNENARFDVTANSTYFLYTDVSPQMLFKENSTTTITTKSGLFYASGSSSHIASSFILEENASFVAYKNTSNTVPMFKCLSNFTLKSNSTFQLYSEVISSTALMFFGEVANINITSPQNVVLYNRGGNIFSFASGSESSPNVINIYSQMVRLWDYAKYPLEDAGGFDNAPNTEYYKQNYAENINFEIKANSKQLIALSSNLTSADVGYPISTTNFKLLTSNVISMGKMDLNVYEITDNSKTISGLTNENSNIKVEYLTVIQTAKANSYGSFSINLNEQLQINTNVKISTNNQFLTKTVSTIVNGSVYISDLLPLKFKMFTTNSNQSLIFREKSDWSIQIVDTRADGDWFLYAYILNPLSSGENTLDNALVFKQKDVEFVMSQKPILIASKAKQDKTIITWDTIEGFLLKLDKNKNYHAGEYQTEIMWEVTTKPVE